VLYQVRPEGRLGVPTFFGMKPSEIACVSFVGTKLSQDCQPSRQANSGTYIDCIHSAVTIACLHNQS